MQTKIDQRYLLFSEPESGLEEGEAQVQMGRMMTFMQVREFF